MRDVPHVPQNSRIDGCAIAEPRIDLGKVDISTSANRLLDGWDVYVALRRHAVEGWKVCCTLNHRKGGETSPFKTEHEDGRGHRFSIETTKSETIIRLASTDSSDVLELPY